jgi:hypothetical protein
MGVPPCARDSDRPVRQAHPVFRARVRIPAKIDGTDIC